MRAASELAREPRSSREEISLAIKPDGRSVAHHMALLWEETGCSRRGSGAAGSWGHLGDSHGEGTRRRMPVLQLCSCFRTCTCSFSRRFSHRCLPRNADATRVAQILRRISGACDQRRPSKEKVSEALIMCECVLVGNRIICLIK